MLDVGLNQEAIDKRIEENKEHNRTYIEKLKSEGRYGEEYSITIRLCHNDLFDKRDAIEVKSSPLQPYKMIFLDLKD